MADQSLSFSAMHGAPLERIAVFRALQLGDMLCAVPALRALRQAYPNAQITLIGLPWAATWCERLPHVDQFVEFPGWPSLPERAVNFSELPRFIAQLQAARFDLAIQLHGSGNLVNPLVAAFNARDNAGFVLPHEWQPEAWTTAPWPTHGHEIERCLRLSDALGAKRAGVDLEFPVRPEDRAAIAQHWPQLVNGDYVCLHLGAQLESRRWPVARYAQVAQTLSQAGIPLVLTGTANERHLADALQRALENAFLDVPLLDLVGQTSLWQLGALVERARLVLCNDTGISHIAAALQTPSVIISSGADTERWAPLDHERHLVLASYPSCRPCAWRHCPTQHECATAIEPMQVVSAVWTQLSRYWPDWIKTKNKLPMPLSTAWAIEQDEQLFTKENQSATPA